MKKSNYKKGFALIDLMVALLVSGMMLGLGYMFMYNFNIKNTSFNKKALEYIEDVHNITSFLNEINNTSYEDLYQVLSCNDDGYKLKHPITVEDNVAVIRELRGGFFMVNAKYELGEIRTITSGFEEGDRVILKANGRCYQGEINAHGEVEVEGANLFGQEDIVIANIGEGIKENKLIIADDKLLDEDQNVLVKGVVGAIYQYGWVNHDTQLIEWGDSAQDQTYNTVRAAFLKDKTGNSLCKSRWMGGNIVGYNNLCLEVYQYVF